MHRHPTASTVSLFRLERGFRHFGGFHHSSWLLSLRLCLFAATELHRAAVCSEHPQVNLRLRRLQQASECSQSSTKTMLQADKNNVTSRWRTHHANQFVLHALSICARPARVKNGLKSFRQLANPKPTPVQLWDRTFRLTCWSKGGRQTAGEAPAGSSRSRPRPNRSGLFLTTGCS